MKWITRIAPYLKAPTTLIMPADVIVPEQPFTAALPDQPSTEPLFDPYSPTWRFVRAHLLDRLQKLRESNDSPRNDPDKTALIRGRIREIKDLLEIEKPKPMQRQDDDDDL